MRNPIAAAASRFAHLASTGKKPSASKLKAEEEKKDEDRKDESAAADDDEDERMEDDDTSDTSASTDDGDEDKDEKKDGKKSKKAAEDDDEECEDDDGEKEAKAVRRGRRMERSRWSSVLSSAHAARNQQLAVTLLADTSKSPEHIIGRLKNASSAGGSAERRDRNPRIETSDMSAPASQQALAESWDRAFAKTAPAQR